MSLLILLQSQAAPAIVGQSAFTSPFKPGTKAVLRDYFTNVNVPTSVFPAKAVLRDSFVGLLSQTSDVVGALRGYAVKRNSLDQLVTSNLVMYLDADSTASYPGTGTTWTSLTNSLTATISGPTYTSGGADYFLADGINDYIVTGDIKSYFTGSTISVFIWVYPIAAGQIYVELGQSTINTNWHASNIEINTSGAFSFSLWHGSLTTKVVSANQSFNQWYYVGLTYSGTTLTAYINGVSVGQATLTRQMTSTFYVALFAIDSTNMGTGAYGNARVNKLQLYSSALTSNEVLANYNSTKSLFGL